MRLKCRRKYRRDQSPLETLIIIPFPLVIPLCFYNEATNNADFNFGILQPQHRHIRSLIGKKMFYSEWQMYWNWNKKEKREKNQGTINVWIEISFAFQFSMSYIYHIRWKLVVYKKKKAYDVRWFAAVGIGISGVR